MNIVLLYLLSALASGWLAQWLFALPWYGAVFGGVFFGALLLFAALTLCGIAFSARDIVRFALTGRDPEQEACDTLSEALRESEETLKAATRR